MSESLRGLIVQGKGRLLPVFVMPLMALYPKASTTAKRLARAIELAGLTEQQACAEMEIRQAHWSEAKAGDRRLPHLDRLALLPEVMRWYAVLTLEDEGLPREVRRAARLCLALMGRKRMALMSAAAIRKTRAS